MTPAPQVLRAGIDVGSTTVKLAVLDADDQLLYGSYERHKADIRGTLIAVIEAAHEALAAREQDLTMSVAVTGSGGLSVSQWLELPFVQEVIAGSRAVRRFLPDTDVAIELGGEDAKITYFTGGLEQRMNGTCAGGNGSFHRPDGKPPVHGRGGFERACAQPRNDLSHCGALRSVCKDRCAAPHQ